MGGKFDYQNDPFRNAEAARINGAALHVVRYGSEAKPLSAAEIEAIERDYQARADAVR